MHHTFAQQQIIAERIRKLLADSKQPIIVGIDGRCASGKTTLAASLAREFHCDVIHADDFYLRKEQRSLARMKEPGGNLDRERMMKEIFGPLYDCEEITYRPFDCSAMELAEEKKARVRPLLIIEGAYCMHPLFRDFYDLKVFVDIEPIPQMIRLVQRNGADMAEVFEQRWIPLEEQYLDYYQIQKQCDIVI